MRQQERHSRDNISAFRLDQSRKGLADHARGLCARAISTSPFLHSCPLSSSFSLHTYLGLFNPIICLIMEFCSANILHSCDRLAHALVSSGPVLCMARRGRIGSCVSFEVCSTFYYIECELIIIQGHSGAIFVGIITIGDNFFFSVLATMLEPEEGVIYNLSNTSGTSVFYLFSEGVH